MFEYLKLQTAYFIVLIENFLYQRKMVENQQFIHILALFFVFKFREFQ